MDIVLTSIVLLGGGFTPQVFTPRALHGLIDDEPDFAAASQAIAIVQYSSGYQIIVQEQRVEVKRDKPPAGEDALMQAIAQKLISFWPLAELRAVGLNVFLADVNVDDDRRAAIRRRLTDERYVTGILGGELTAATFEFRTSLHDAKVQVSVDTAAAFENRPSLGLRVNAHYESIGDLAAVLRLQSIWYERTVNWAEEFFHGE